MASLTNSTESFQIEEKSIEWRAIVLASIITFLSMVESNIISMGEFPYMRQLDPEATSSFFGLVTSICKLGNAIFVVVFAIWSHRWHVSKIPLLAGRLICLAGCILYICVEFFPFNRRIVLIFCYLLFGIGSSNGSILRAYVSLKSAEEDRSKAFALFNVSLVIGIIFGPICQLIFSGIPYPGYRIVGEIYFHIYSAPIFMAFLLNIISLLVIAILFKDPEVLKRSDSSPWSFRFSSMKEVVKSKWHQLRGMPFSWPLAGVVILQKGLSQLTMATMQAVAAPMMMVQFALPGDSLVVTMAVCQMVVGALALGLSALFLFGKLGKIISSRLLFALAYVIVIAMYVASYPWPMWSSHVLPYNATTQTGCNPKEYSWCDTALTSSMWTLIPVMTLVMGLAVPSLSISLDSIYSKILGNIDQNLMQSLMILSEDIAQVVGPLYSAAIFTASGVHILWIVNCSIVVGALALWIAVWRPLGRYK